LTLRPCGGKWVGECDTGPSPNPGPSHPAEPEAKAGGSGTENLSPHVQRYFLHAQCPPPPTLTAQGPKTHLEHKYTHHSWPTPQCTVGNKHTHLCWPPQTLESCLLAHLPGPKCLRSLHRYPSAFSKFTDSDTHHVPDCTPTHTHMHTHTCTHTRAHAHTNAQSVH
jgi:hypothetical protein